ncbi:unnamed protein product [Rotaria sp. Silwood2]|nr:unnamed protein product [Rotaria sp. Silwood2]CAF2979963.1 unnamed protein product [Rotaria sp. Silwood2]CAF3346617.1 unnamed protein product [Rotaria sp. Silwood2]CAF4505185.1 unnamed protein product [Rotaria sp. Silwood2]CAF4553839.1 unnamed protein product [Rotaria sp. Silwood2]
MPTDDIHILSSSDSRILISLNVTDPSSSSNSSSIELTSCSIERIYYLLKTEKQQCSIIKNKISPPAVFFWPVFGFPAELNKKTGIFEIINGHTSCKKCKKTFVYGSNSGTRHMKQHPCVTDLITQSTSSSKDVSMTQTIIEKNTGYSIYGKIEVNDILRCRSTISSHIQVMAESCHARIKNFLEEPYKNGSLPISPDFWCNK